MECVYMHEDVLYWEVCPLSEYQRFHCIIWVIYLSFVQAEHICVREIFT